MDIIRGNDRYDVQIGEIANRNAEAFSELYVSMKKSVYLLALSILRSEAMAEDVVQETFMKIYKSAAGYKSKSSAKAWIMTIGRNTALDALRANKHTQQLDQDSYDIPDREEAAEQAAMADLNFLKATNGMNEIDKSILIMHIFERFPHSEISKITGLPAGNVRVRYHRALKRLRAFYESY